MKWLRPLGVCGSWPWRLVFAVVVALSTTAAARRPAEVVATLQGAQRGIVTDQGIRRFAGIPYAAPPLGDLRWRPPQPAAGWTGVRDGTAFGSPCVQPDSGREDCLYLNVYAPMAGTKLPVMVWIHGGAFVRGSGSSYDPTPLVQSGNVVAVTFNYRLGVMGALAVPELDAESPQGSGALALLDQQAALRWVRQNIANFGGDPDNVTIFGQSAGGAFVCLNMASPSADGLFHVAIAQSGCGLGGLSRADAQQFARNVAQRLGCLHGGRVDLACLRSRPADQIVAAADAAGPVAAAMQIASVPPVGSRTLPFDIPEAFQTGRFSKVPLMVGHAQSEGRLFVETNTYGPTPSDRAGYLARLKDMSLPVERVAAEYPLGAYPGPAEALANVLGDMSFICPSLRATSLAASLVPVYSYEFSDAGASRMGATHGTELAYLFAARPEAPVQPVDAAAANTPFAEQLRGYWTSFARVHRPEANGAPAWPPYSPDEPATQRLAPGGTAAVPARTVAEAHHCAFWDTIDSRPWLAL